MVSALYDPLNRYYQQLRTAQVPGVSTVPGGPAYGGFGDWVNQNVRNNLWSQAESAPASTTGGAESSSTSTTGGPVVRGINADSSRAQASAGTESSPVSTAATGPAPVATAATTATPAGALPSWASQTAGRSGRSYQSLINDPNFDPWTNGDSYWGAGGSQDPAIQQAFGYTNQMARGMGYSDGSRLPPDLKRQIFLANLERTRQQYADNGQNWDATAAAKLPSQGWSYTPGWGLTHGGQSYETQGPGPAGQTGGAPAPTPAPAGSAPVATTTTGGTGGTGGATGTTGGTTGADGQFALGGQYWMQHPQEASDAFLRSHGINPDAHTAMGDWMLKQVQGLVPGLFGTYFGSGGQNPTDQLSDPNQLLNSIFYGGGGIGGNLQRYAGNAMNILRNNPTMQANLGDTGTQQFLQTLEGLNTYGMNPYMGQAYSNAFDAAMNRQRIAQRGQLFNNQPITSLWDFINQPGQPGFGSYGLPGQ